MERPGNSWLIASCAVGLCTYSLFSLSELLLLLDELSSDLDPGIKYSSPLRYEYWIHEFSISNTSEDKTRDCTKEAGKRERRPKITSASFLSYLPSRPYLDQLNGTPLLEAFFTNGGVRVFQTSYSSLFIEPSIKKRDLDTTRPSDTITLIHVSLTINFEFPMNQQKWLRIVKRRIVIFYKVTRLV